MRLIRTIVQPANIALSRQLQHSQTIKTSTDLLHQVLIETCNREHGSNRRWFVRLYSSASPDPLETNNTRRRVSRNERKSMVENFVIRYREMNAGKFPSVTEAKNDVGGSYYLVREILQELVYNSKKTPSVDNTKNGGLPEKKVIIKHEISSRNAGEVITPIPTVDLEESISKSFKSDQEPNSSILVKVDESKDVGMVHENEQKFTLALEPENGKTANEDEEKLGDEIIVHEKDEQKSDVLQSKAELQESTEEVSERESHKVTTEDAVDKTKPSMWQNLKSFANGILDVWKRY